MPDNGQVKGTVKKWYPDKGFGFIKPDGGGPDVFAHFSSVLRLGDLSQGRRNLHPGQRVEFDLDHGPKGAFAVNVAVLVESTG